MIKVRSVEDIMSDMQWLDIEHNYDLKLIEFSIGPHVPGVTQPINMENLMQGEKNG
jgi:hypothetical protein